MKYQRPVHSILAAILCASSAWAFQARAEEVTSEYQRVLTILGKQGDFKASVLKRVGRNSRAHPPKFD
jgi:hypothetical protein